MFIGRGGTGREAVTWAVSRERNAENETDRVNLQSQGKFKAGIDLNTYSDISNNLTCSTFLIYGKTGIIPRPLVYSNVSQSIDSDVCVCVCLFVCLFCVPDLNK